MPHPRVYSPPVCYHKQKQRLKYIHLNIWLLTLSFYSLLPKALQVLLVQLPSHPLHLLLKTENNTAVSTLMMKNKTKHLALSQERHLTCIFPTIYEIEKNLKLSSACFVMLVISLINPATDNQRKAAFEMHKQCKTGIAFFHHGGELDCLGDQWREASPSHLHRKGSADEHVSTTEAQPGSAGKKQAHTYISVQENNFLQPEIFLKYI